MSTRLRWLLRTINFYPPFLGAGIRIRLAPDLSVVDVEMKLRFWNRNAVGTQFGGSLYAMTDPFYMLMLMERLGRDYIVWDKAACIHFRRPGRGRVRAQFRITDAQLEAFRAQLETARKIEPEFVVEVKDDAGDVVAEVHKTIYIRKK